MATVLYTGLIGLLLVILTMRVIALRGNPAIVWFTFGYSGGNALVRAIRAHGNLTEYAPFFLLMMFIAEKDGYSSLALHYYGRTFLLGRLLHGICFGFMNESFLLRVVGTVLTLSPILGLSTILIIRYFGI